jgi:hypothetical protein
MADNDCIKCGGSGWYGCRVCAFCAGSGISSKLRSFDTFPVLLIIATILFALAAYALNEGFKSYVG